MKGKYITTQIWLACLSKPTTKKKNIHAQLEETIAERKSIMLKMESALNTARVIDIYLHGNKAA